MFLLALSALHLPSLSVNSSREGNVVHGRSESRQVVVDRKEQVFGLRNQYIERGENHSRKEDISHDLYNRK